MNMDGWMKAAMNLKTFCGTNNLSPQVLFYDGHSRHFLNRSIHILHSNNIKTFILNVGDWVNYQSNDNSPKFKLKGLYGYARMNFLRQHGILRFTNDHMNAVLVKKWRDFHISSDPIIINSSKKRSLVNLNPPDEWTNIQACLAESQTPKGGKGEEIKVIDRSIIAPEDAVIIRTTEPMFVLREKVNVGS